VKRVVGRKSLPTGNKPKTVRKWQKREQNGAEMTESERNGRSREDPTLGRNRLKSVKTSRNEQK